MKHRYFKKEFILYTDNDIPSLYFEALPSIGRYFQKDCQKIRDGVFRVCVEVPEGDLFYNFRDSMTQETIAPGTDCCQEGLKDWHYYKLGTDDPLPVKFQPNSSFCNRISARWYEIRIIAYQKWIQQVFIHFYDDAGSFLGEAAPEICFYFKGIRYLRYLIPFREPFQHRFCFEIHGHEQVYYYGANQKLSKKLPPLFQIPQMTAPPSIKNQLTPAGPVYQIFPDTFYRAPESRSLTPHIPLLPWNTPPLPGAFFGGNLQGIYLKLNYLKSLGVSSIYFTPIFPANSNHRYDSRTFNEIDPLLGSPEELEQLIAGCHDRGIKVIFDAILNHCGTDFWAFQDLLINQDNSVYQDWFIVHQYPVTTTPDAEPTYSCWWNIGTMPQFNLENPVLIAYLLEVYSFWLTRYQIDGFRIDVASEIGYPLLRQFTEHLKQIRPDILFIGEVWGESCKFLNYGLFDGVTNYQLRQNAFIPYFVTKKISLSEFAHSLMSNYFSTPFPQMLQSWNLLDSHDTPRFASLTSNEQDLRLAVFLQILLPGNPVIYYGDEVGLEGGGDPDNRRSMDWERLPGNPLYDWYQRLLAIRNQEPALQKGDFTILEASDETSQLIFSRRLNTEIIYCIVNFASNQAPGDLRKSIPPGSYTELLTGQAIPKSFTLEPNQAWILKKQGNPEGGFQLTHHNYLGRPNSQKPNPLEVVVKPASPVEPGCIIHIAAEIAPFSKRGGLGDVVGSLPIYLGNESGRKNLIFTPYYNTLTGRLAPVYQGVVEFNGIECEYRVLQSNLKTVDCYFIRLEEAYAMDDVYSDGAQPYQAEAGLFYFCFGKCVIDYLIDSQIHPGTIFTHDWHAAGIYPYLRRWATATGKAVDTIHVIHNYHHQGEVYYSIKDFLEPEVTACLEKQYQETGYCSMSSIAVRKAARVITVSPTYALELQSQTAPHPGLELFLYRKNQISGILNGIDDTVWNPAADPYLALPYALHTLERKHVNKDFLLKKLGFAGLNLPVVVLISRLTTQKGIDLFVDLRTGRPFDMYARMKQFLENGLLLVIYGSPEGGMKGSIDLQLNALQKKFSPSFRYINQYTEELAHQLIAGADILLQPSRFEPCGLTQMYAMKYGTVPVVTPVGGLKDTVLDYQQSGDEGTGFLMKDFSFPALNEALSRALALYRDQARWLELAKRCMSQDNSWSKRAQAYLALVR